MIVHLTIFGEFIGFGGCSLWFSCWVPLLIDWLVRGWFESWSHWHRLVDVWMCLENFVDCFLSRLQGFEIVGLRLEGPIGNDCIGNWRDLLSFIGVWPCVSRCGPIVHLMKRSHFKERIMLLLIILGVVWGCVLLHRPFKLIVFGNLLFLSSGPGR